MECECAAGIVMLNGASKCVCGVCLFKVKRCPNTCVCVCVCGVCHRGVEWYRSVSLKFISAPKRVWSV